MSGVLQNSVLLINGKFLKNVKEEKILMFVFVILVNVCYICNIV